MTSPRNTAFFLFDGRDPVATIGRHAVNFSIQNVGNLINDAWGLEKRPQAANNAVKIMKVRHRPFPRGDKGNENGYYVYEFDPNSVEEDELYQTRNFGSRWAMQVGLRYSF